MLLGKIALLNSAWDGAQGYLHVLDPVISVSMRVQLDSAYTWIQRQRARLAE